MAKNVKETGPQPKPAKSWTLLLVGELGNIISFRLTKTSLYGFLIFFITILSFSIIASVTYVGLQLKNKSLKKDLDIVTSKLLAANKAIEEAQVRLMLLEGKGKARSPQAPNKKIQPKEKAEPVKKVQPPPQLVLAKKKKPKEDIKQNEKPKDPIKGQPSPQKDQLVAKKKGPSPFVTAAAAKPPIPSSEETAGIDATEEDKLEENAPASIGQSETSNTAQEGENDAVASIATEPLEVDKLQIWKTAGQRSIKFQFSLKNVSATGEKIKGYTFVVLKPVEGSTEPARGSPWTPLENGKPAIFKRGQYFSIARFKYVRGSMPQIQDVNRFETATIFVYTELGELLLEKVFYVDDILKS